MCFFDYEIRLIRCERAVTVDQDELQVSVDDLVLTGGICHAPGPRAGILLLHGIPSVAPKDPDDEGYPGLAKRLAAQGYSAAWLDMRAARGQPGFFSIEGWVRDATAAIEALRKGAFNGLAFVLAGSSAGGAVAAEAVKRGAVVDGLVLLAAPAEWTSYAVHPEAGVERIMQDSGMVVAPEVQADPSEWGEEFLRVATEKAIGDVDVPVLIVQGDEDFVVPPEHATRIAGRAPGAEVHMIAGGGHQLRRDSRAVEIIVEWLRSHFP